MIPRLEERLTGAFATIPVPLNEDLSIDLDGVGEIAERAIARGLRGVVVFADPAEASHLSREERERVLAQVVTRSAGRATILCGLRAPSAAVAVEEGER